MPLKDFAHIESDYAFFMAHSTEAERGLDAYARELVRFRAPQEPIRMLDFGCGAGEFTERLLVALDWPPELLQLSLVEPVSSQREQAARRLGRFSSQPILSAEGLLSSDRGPFDLVISNHVLYYVEELQDTLRRLHDSLAPAGLLLAAIAGWDNVLLRLWQVGFAKLNRPVPYHAAEDVEECLSRLGFRCDTQTVRYEIRFPDSVENRSKILRFLFGHYLPEIGDTVLLPEFDRYVAGDNIYIETDSVHFVVRRAE